MKIAFLGAGNMGSALIRGALKAKAVKAKDVTAFDVQSDALARLKKAAGIRSAKSNADAVSAANYIFLCVKPQQMAEVLAGIKGRISPKQCLISIAAGVRTEKIEAAFGPAPVSVVRVMPNTPAMIGFGASAVCGGKAAREADIRFAIKFFASVGKAVRVSEEAMDAVTALSGSGPAYVFYLAEALLKAARAEGLASDAAKVLIEQTLLGSARMLGGKDSPSQLRRKVTSPGGTTEAALRHLEESKWAETFVEAVRRAAERSRQLSRL